MYVSSLVFNATANRWFQLFRSWKMDDKDAARSGGLIIVVNIDKIMEIIKLDQHQSIYSIAQLLHQIQIS